MACCLAVVVTESGQQLCFVPSKGSAANIRNGTPRIHPQNRSEIQIRVRDKGTKAEREYAIKLRNMMDGSPDPLPRLTEHNA